MSDVANKWGVEVAERGFTQIPNYLLLLNQFLDKEHRLSPVELLVLFQLAGAWWKKDALPFPAMSTLAIRCGVSERQIQRAVNQLEKIGLIRRVKRRNGGIIASNAYDLSPLVSILAEVSKAFPTDFPRRVERDRVQQIVKKLEALSTASIPTIADSTDTSLAAPAVAAGGASALADRNGRVIDLGDPSEATSEEDVI